MPGQRLRAHEVMDGRAGDAEVLGCLVACEPRVVAAQGESRRDLLLDHLPNVVFKSFNVNVHESLRRSTPASVTRRVSLRASRFPLSGSLRIALG